MTNPITLALVLAATLLLATPSVYAAPSQPDKCAKQGVVTDCSKVKQAQNRKPHKTIKRRGRNIDPITTCAVGKGSPCMPKRP